MRRRYPRWQTRVVILDGGLSNALVARGHDLSDDLWTASLLRDVAFCSRSASPFNVVATTG